MEEKIKQVKKTKRIYYLDILRGLAVFFMVMQHSILVLEYSEGTHAGILGTTFVILGTAPAAPIFMLVMGIFIMKSKADNWSFVKRGLKLLAAGYGLNFIRFTTPLLIDGNSKEALQMLFYVDIFQLAGVFFITSIFLKKLAKNIYFTSALILAILYISPTLWGITSQNPITDLFWGNGETVSFPYFPWCVYPLLGMNLSEFICCNNINKKYRTRIITIALFIGGLGLLLLTKFPYLNYERFGLGASLVMIAFVLLYLVIIERMTYIYQWTSKNRIISLLLTWSVDITNIYLISWTLFTLIAVVIGYNMFNDIVSASIGITVMGMTHLLIKHTEIDRIIPKT